MVVCLLTILRTVKSLTATIKLLNRLNAEIKLNELSFELLPHPPYSPDLAPSDCWLFSDLKKMLQGKRFVSNEEVIAEVEAYFESKDESFYKKGHRKVKEALE